MFISFEGGEGSGKSSALAGLATLLKSRGLRVLVTREPGGSPLGAVVRKILLDPRNNNIAPKAELFLYLADRAQHVATVIRPALENGDIVLTDRYADSTIVYQGFGRGLDPEELLALNENAVDGLWPDRTFLFDLDPATGLARARERNKREGTAVTEGRFEAEHVTFHQQVREGFLAWAARFPQRYRIIDASRPQAEVLAATLAEVEALLSQP